MWNSLRLYCALHQADLRPHVHICYRRMMLPTAWVVFVLLLSPRVYADVAVNIPLDDSAYPLLEKLVISNLTFANALTIKPITRLYAARLIAEALRRRRHELETSQRQDPFTDRILQHLARRFKRELQQIRFFYRPRRPGPFFFAPLAEFTLEMVGAHDQFVLRDSSGLTDNLQGVFGLAEGFAPGNDFTLRIRASSWATLWRSLAAYVETDVRVQTDPLIGDTFDATLYKGYAKVGAMNLELEFGRDTLWWGPASQGDLVLSNNAPPLDLIKLSTPHPFRLPGVLRHLGTWQFACVAARLEAERAIPHAWLSGVRVTYQPAAFLQFGYTNMFQAFGDGGVQLGAPEYLEKLFAPTLETSGRTVNGLMAYNLVLSLPFVREMGFLQGVQVYWQRGFDNRGDMRGVLSGGNIIGGVLDGGHWDVQVEFAETRDGDAVWYTHPLYRSGFAFKQFVLGHPIGGAAESLFGRAVYYLTPSTWLALDGRREQYGFDVQPTVTTQFRFGFEASHQFSLARQRSLTLWGRLEYASLDRPEASVQHTFSLRLAVRWRML
jgi:hypothetical protein